MGHTQTLHTLQKAIPSGILYLIPLFILAAIIKSSWFKGNGGEAVVSLSARLFPFLDKTRYYLIKKATLQTEDGTTQIDHIIVSRYDVFVVETKNIKGWIFGNAKQRYLSQKIFKYSQKFEKPLDHNYKNVKKVRHCWDCTMHGINPW